MRIAFFHNLPSGGGKRALYEMTRRLAAQHTLDIYTLATAEHDFCDLRPYSRSHEVFPFSPLPLLRSPFGRFNQGIRTLDLLRLRRVQRSIAHRIDDAGYDVVFVHNCRYGQSPSLLQFLKTPSVYYCAEPPRLLYEPAVPRPYTEFSRVQRLGNLFDPLPGLYRRTLARLDCANVQAATRVLTNSHYSRETLYRTYGIFAHVAYLGVDTEKFRLLGLPREDFVLSVGALNSSKGFDFLIESLAFLDTTQRPSLVIISNFQDIRERQYLEQLATARCVSVVFKTLITDDELVSLYNRAQLTLYAPIMEPFGFVPLESMACGTPVVGVREAGVRETITDGSTGILVERDLAMMATAIRRLLTNPALVSEYGNHARAEMTERWTWDRSIMTLERFLKFEEDRCFR